MRKTIRNITVCMILVMVCAFINDLPAFADESVEANVGDVVTEELEEETYNADKPSDNDSLFENYIESRLMTVGESEVAGRRGAKLEGVNRAIYNKLKKEIALVADGSRTSTIFEVTVDELNLEKNEWNAADLEITAIVEDNAITEEAQISLLNQLNIDLSAIVRALIADCPYELYWFDKVVGVSMSGLGMEATYYGEEWHLSLSSGITTSFAVAQGYADGNYQVDTTNAKRVQHAVDKAARIVEDAKEKTDYDKLVYYRETICGLVTYDYASAEDSSTPYGDAWQVISVFDEETETNVVCEGYSKAFQYLCDLTSFDGDISCVTVTGRMADGTGEGVHMWNIINMEDDKNYLVDVTNCDEGTIGADDQLFLAGQESGEVNTGYTYKCESGTVIYTYDADTLKDYDTELIMSDQRYKEYSIEVTEDNLVYKITGNHATLIGHEGDLTSVVIPSTVRGVPVTSIGNNAFCQSETLTNIFIPENVEVVGENAFYNCCQLRWVSIRNPECELFDSKNTFDESAIICGYPGSTAENYAKKYNRNFISLNDTNPQEIYMVDKVEPTCLNEGMMSYYTDNINRYLDEEGRNIVSEEDLIIPKLDHDWEADYTVDKEPTCKAEGIKSIHCARCDATKDSESIPVKSHTKVIIKGYPATCTKSGKTDGAKCSTCGSIIQAQKTISPTHKVSKWKIIKKPTVLKTGQKTGKCSVCKKIVKQTIAKVPATISVKSKVSVKVKKSTTIKVKYKKGDGIKSWTSSNKKVATVTKKGKVTGKSKGTAILTVKLKSGKIAKVTVTVK